MKNKDGFAALVSVLTISAIALAISVSLSLRSIDSAKILTENELASKSMVIYESCIEEALYRIKTDGTYTGGNVSLGDGSCLITVSETYPTDNIYTATVNATVSQDGTDFVKSNSILVKRAGESVVIINNYGAPPVQPF